MQNMPCSLGSLFSYNLHNPFFNANGCPGKEKTLQSSRLLEPNSGRRQLNLCLLDQCAMFSSDLGFTRLGYNPNSGKLFNLLGLSSLIYKMGLTISHTSKHIKIKHAMLSAQSIMTISNYYYHCSV